MAEAFSETLAYPQVKKRAVASRSFRTKITPSNGSTFTGGNTIHNTTTLVKCILNSK